MWVKLSRPRGSTWSRMFSTATSPATSLRRVHDDVGRSRAATSQPSNRASSHGSTPPTCVLTPPVEYGGLGVLSRLAADPPPRFSEQESPGSVTYCNRGGARRDRAPFGLCQ